jgi:hypothetical protein
VLLLSCVSCRIASFVVAEFGECVVDVLVVVSFGVCASLLLEVCGLNRKGRHSNCIVVAHVCRLPTEGIPRIKFEELSFEKLVRCE